MKAEWNTKQKTKFLFGCPRRILYSPRSGNARWKNTPFIQQGNRRHQISSVALKQKLSPLLQSELQFRLDVVGRKSYLGYEITRFCRPLLRAVIVERQGTLADGDAHILLLTWLKVNLLESLQFFLRTWQRTFRVGNIELHCRGTCHRSRIGHAHRHRQGVEC